MMNLEFHALWIRSCEFKKGRKQKKLYVKKQIDYEKDNKLYQLVNCIKAWTMTNV